MAVRVSKVDVWVGQIKDKPGTLLEKLEVLTEAGANLEFMIARRATDKPGKTAVFLAPLRGPKQTKAAQKAGFKKARRLHSLRCEAPDKPGLGVRMTRAIADAGVNMRGISTAGIGKQTVTYFAFDREADAKKAASALRKTFRGK